MKTNPFDFIFAGLLMAFIAVGFFTAAQKLGANQGLSFDENALIDPTLLTDQVDSISASVKTVTIESQNWFTATISSIVELPSIVKSLLDLFLAIPELFRQLLVFIGLPDDLAGLAITFLIMLLVADILLMLYKAYPVRTD